MAPDDTRATHPFEFIVVHGNSECVSAPTDRMALKNPEGVRVDFKCFYCARK